MKRMTLTIHEVAKAIGISLPKAYELAHREGFPTLTVGRRMLVPQEEFEKWIADQTVHGGKA